ncbi:MAG: DUF1080 domain-containing protein, partial [Pontibacter sp.]|nr:DUF1080 domain-containing protein [Pontibacter sp.]
MSKCKTTQRRGVLLAGLAMVCSTGISLAQTKAPQTAVIPLNNLSSFQSPGKSWQVAGDVTARLDKDNVLNVVDGTGILVNDPGKKNRGTDLITNLEHGDLDLELDYMMARGSNSG